MHGRHHRHAPDPGGIATVARHERRTWAAAALMAAAAGAELAGGLATGSSALLAEAAHMAAHVSAFVLAGVAYALGRLAARSGHAMAGQGLRDLASLANGGLLLALAVGLAIESAMAAMRPMPVAYGPALGLAAFGVTVNLASAALLHHPHEHEAGHGRDLNFRAVYWHVLGDAAAGLLAMAGLTLGAALGWRWGDPAAGLLGAGLVAWLGAKIVRDSWRQLRAGRERALPPLPVIAAGVERRAGTAKSTDARRFPVR